MSWYPVPYFVDGATHPAEIMRLLAYAATSGAEGVIGGTDCKVVPLATPGAGVQVSTGAVLVLNRATSGDQQTYAAKNPTSDTIGVTATGSGAGRSDLVVAMIEDPNMPGNAGYKANVTAAATGPYIWTRIVPNVPAGTKRLQDVPGHEREAGVTRARIDIPANTATVTAAMIVDLRKVARMRRDRSIQQGATSAVFDLTSTGYTQVQKVTVPTVDIPAWASEVNIRMDLAGVIPKGGATGGFIRAQIGTAVLATPTSYNDQRGDGATRVNLTVADTVAIPSALRGTTQQLQLWGYKQSAGPGYLEWQTTTQMFWDVEFVERAS